MYNNIFRFLCSDQILKKKASMLFGIRFEEKNYEILKEYLTKIKEKTDLVSLFFTSGMFNQ